MGESRRPSLCVGGKEKRFACFRDGCAASLEECMRAASSMSTKRLRTGCAARSRALAVLCRGRCKEALKKGLMRFDVAMKPQVKAIE